MAVLSSLLCTGQCFGFVSQTVQQSIILFHTTGHSSIQKVSCNNPSGRQRPPVVCFANKGSWRRSTSMVPGSETL